MQRYGPPLAIYTDKHTTYRSPAEPTVQEQLAGREPQRQFGRALNELGVALIPAHSPQAKGLVERLFKTFQDCVIKELRRAGGATLAEANRFLESYLPSSNQRFAVSPAHPADLHRAKPASRVLEQSLCLKTTRCVRNDLTILYQGQLYQIHNTIRAPHVQVEERRDGTLRLTRQGRSLGFHAIPSRSILPVAEAKKAPRPRRPVTPRLDHPWRTRLWPD